MIYVLKINIVGNKIAAVAVFYTEDQNVLIRSITFLIYYQNAVLIN